MTTAAATPIPDQYFWGTATVYQEAAGESFLGKLAVAYVIVNRARRERRSISDTVLRSWQFSCWNTDSPTRMNLDQVDAAAWAECDRAFRAAMDGTVKDPTDGATHYLHEAATRASRKDGSLPSWFNERNVTLREGRHTFLKLVA